MFYCFDFYKTNISYIRQQIEHAKNNNTFLYYSRMRKKILDKNKKVVDVKGMRILPITGVLQISSMIDFLVHSGAVLPNGLDDIEMILSWYQYIETNRNIIPFTGKMLEDKTFLTYLIETFDIDEEIFFKTRKKDFHSFIKLGDLINKESDLREAISYHLDDEFFISKKVEIVSDRIGTLEYRSFIMDKKIMNISRNTNITFHKVPNQIVDFVNNTIHNLPDEFPTTFVLDTYVSKNGIDVLEFNPIEGSGPYLYNSCFSFSDDLTHTDIENVPIEKDKKNLSYDLKENMVPSITPHIPNSFARDYQKIRRFEKLNHLYQSLSNKDTCLSSILEDFNPNPTNSLIDSFQKIKK